MGAISLQTSRGAQQYADLFNSTRDEIMSGDTPTDQIYGSNPGIGDMVISPVLYTQWQNKKNIKGGLGLTGIGMVDTVNGGPTDPYAPHALAEAPTQTKVHKLGSLCYVTIPIMTYPADIIQNRGEAQIIDIQKMKMRGALLKASITLARLWYGNKDGYWDVKKGATEALAQTPWVYTPNFLPFAGLGYGNSAVTDCMIGDANIYGTLNRALAENILYRPVVKHSGLLSQATDGVPPFDSWSDLSLDHMDWLIDQCRVGTQHGKLVAIPQIAWTRVKQIVRSKQIYEQNLDMLKIGLQNVLFNGATIVPDYEFKPQNSLDCWDPENSYIAFADGELPAIGDAVPLPGVGYKAVVAELNFACQSWAKYPRQFSRLVLTKLGE